MTGEQRNELLDALRHGVTGDPELDLILAEDLAAIEPIIDQWLVNARDYYFEWAQHKEGCVFTEKFGPCPCGLLKAIENRRTV